jgi:hypothetical protein
MSQEREILNNNDVVSVLKHDEGRFASGDTLKVFQLLAEYEGYIKAQTKTSTNSEIFLQGIECEILRQNNNSKGWRKGKIKFVIQFEPEEISNNANSNSLDDIRIRMDSTN